MSEYLKTTNFTAKDSLPAGDVNKKIVGAQFDTEFNNISTAIASKANLSSPALVGVPTAPTATAGNNTTQVATTAFVTTAVTNGVADGKVSPAFTGTPTAPTAAVDTNTTQLATTAFVKSQITSDIEAPLALKAPLDSPTLTGTPTAPTATEGTNTTQIATTAFVTTAISSISLSDVYPVGSIYMNASVATNPGTLLGFGTWASFGSGRVLLGEGDGYTAETTGGSKDAVVVSHTHTGSTDTESDHTHSSTQSFLSNVSGDIGYGGGSNSSFRSVTTGGAGSHSHTLTIDSTGSSGTDANLQPYVVVYMWKRTE